MPHPIKTAAEAGVVLDRTLLRQTLQKAVGLIRGLPDIEGAIVVAVSATQSDANGDPFRPIVPVTDNTHALDVARTAAVLLALAIDKAVKQHADNRKLVIDEFDRILTAILASGGGDHFAL